MKSMTGFGRAAAPFAGHELSVQISSVNRRGIEIAVSLPDGGPTRELEALEWLTFGQANEADQPAITRTILGDLQARLATDPALAKNRDVPFYRMVNGRFRRDLL